MNDSPKSNIKHEDQTSPQFGKNDNFIPLGFSSPINQREKDEGNFYPSQQRNYEVFLSANRRTNYRSHQKNRYYPSNRISWGNRGQNQPQQQQNYNQHQQRNNNRKFYQDKTPCKQDKDGTESYFHSSMLEDPWKNLMANMERKRQGQMDNSQQTSQENAPDKSPSQASGSSKDE